MPKMQEPALFRDLSCIDSGAGIDSLCVFIAAELMQSYLRRVLELLDSGVATEKTQIRG